MTKTSLSITGFVTVGLTGCSEFENKPEFYDPICQRVETEIPSDGSLPTESDVLAVIMSNLPIAVDWLEEDAVWLGTEASPMTIEIERTEDSVYAIQFVQGTGDTHGLMCELDGEYRLMVPLEMTVLVGSIDAGYRATLQVELQVKSISEILLTSPDMSSLEFLGTWDDLFKEEVMSRESFQDENSITYSAAIYSDGITSPWPKAKVTVRADVPNASSSFLIGYWRTSE